MKNKYLILAVYDDRIELLEFSFSITKVVAHNFSKIDLPSGIVDKGRIIDSEFLYQKIEEAIAKAAPNPITATNAILIINNDLIFNHVFYFDGHLEDEYLASMLPNEAEKIIPFARDDIYWDFRVMCGDCGLPNTIVQYYAASKEVIENYLSLFTRLQLVPLLITGRYEAYKVLMDSDDKDDVTKKILILELNKHSIKLIIVSNNVIQEIRIFDFDYERFLTEIASEIDVKQEGYNLKQVPYLDSILANIEMDLSKIDALPQDFSIYVWGEKLVDMYLYQYIHKHFKNLKVHPIWNPVELGPEFRSNKEAVSFINNNKIDFGILAAVAGVFAFNKVNPPLNLLPFNLRSTRAINTISGFLNVAGVVIMILNLGVVFFILVTALNFNFSLRELAQETKNFEQLIYGQKYEQLKNDILNFNKEVDKLYKLSGQIVDLPEVYKQILELSSDSISLSYVNYEKVNKVLELNGKADTRQALLAYKSSIEALEGIDSVDFPLANLDSSQDITFEIKIFLKQ